MGGGGGGGDFQDNTSTVVVIVANIQPSSSAAFKLFSLFNQISSADCMNEESMVVHRDKTLPRIQNTSHTTKKPPRIQTTFHTAKHFPESKTLPTLYNVMNASKQHVPVYFMFIPRKQIRGDLKDL